VNRLGQSISDERPRRAAVCATAQRGTRSAACSSDRRAPRRYTNDVSGCSRTALPPVTSPYSGRQPSTASHEAAASCGRRGRFRARVSATAITESTDDHFALRCGRIVVRLRAVETSVGEVFRDGDRGVPSHTARVPDRDPRLSLRPACETVRRRTWRHLWQSKVPGTSWTIDSKGWMLRVMAVNFPVTLDETRAQSAFDARTGAMARRGCAVLIDTEFTRDGAWGRTNVYELGGGRVFVTSFADGTWTVSITGISTTADPLPTTTTSSRALNSYDRIGD
jgi:hypothetical protein